ncbi:MAG: Crp/Fnr family transcriptional regulator [Acidobacteria bacterium]|nr:MAG: Crp/Fnr family transcriptional regulator [Acidobacteriota bacterium]
MAATSNLSLRNRILAALPAAEYERLLPNLKPVTLAYKQVLSEPNKTIRYVYFPNDGIISMLSTVIDRTLVEVGLVGREGMFGIPVFLGANSTPHQGIVQVAGSAVRMKANLLREEFKRGGRLQDLLLHYTHAHLIMISQTAVCNRIHALDGRLSRWLLMIHDRVDGDEFLLTHDIISQMLGAQRTGVTEAAGHLQKKRMIRYSRGKIAILDRQALEEMACECYWIVKEEFDHLTGARNSSY